MSIASILGPEGAIARRLPHFEARPQQLAMAEAVANAVAGGRKLMVEAGTGVGKSFAYLVPAVLAAVAQKDCRVVVSTHTISLQEQLIRKDIPFLQSVMPQQFTAVLVKGRSNYISLRRLHAAQQRAGAFTPPPQPSPARGRVGVGGTPRSSCNKSASGRAAPPRAAAATSAFRRRQPCGTPSRATAATAWAGPAPTTPNASTSRPASRCSAPSCWWSTTPCSSATSPCAARAAACCRITKS